METPAHGSSRKHLLILSFGALGVVYGDIGTSVLYAFRECFNKEHGIHPTPDNILGILSLIFWSLVIVISLKYLGFVMRADNRGEGGILALMSLVRPQSSGRSKRRTSLIALGLFGAALLYGDGMITPAVSVLSAMEGLDIAAPNVRPYVVPLTLIVLILLFVLQKAGTAKVGAMFGPVMAVWFVAISALGIPHILRHPSVFMAMLPSYAFHFFMANHGHGFLVLGAVFLCVTGGEALYADMGHFGAKPIRLAWFVIVFPALLVNYFGQGAYLLHDPAGSSNPFFLMAPKWTLYPLVALSAMAAVIASQAVISGAFSLTRQAVQLGYLPRIKIRHTSASAIGQIYIPSINWILMIAACGLVLAFEKSTNLAAAYGIAVTATMGITTLLLAMVASERWNWPKAGIVAFALPFLVIDLSFFGANIIKVADGGWFPLAIGLIVFVIMSTWRRGRQLLNERLAEETMSVDDFLRDLSRDRIHRVPGTAIFMTRQHDGVPTTMLHNIKHNKVVHKCVVFLTVDAEETPHLSEDERYEWADLGSGVFRLAIRFGFMEDTAIPALLANLPTPDGVSLNPMTTSYFVGRDTLIPTKKPGMAIWREHLFAWMTRNSTSASQFFDLPANQVIELGAQVEM